MLCLSDSDLVIKLAAFDVWDEALEVLETTRDEVRILPELPRVLQTASVCSRHSRDGIQRALKFVKALQFVGKIDRGEQIILHEAKSLHRNRPIRIDGGEAVLFSATKHLSSFLVATGDKKSLRTLANSATCAMIHARMKGRVICLEQIVLRLITKYGFIYVQQRVGPTCNCDDCVQQAFANGKPTMLEQDCRSWLDGFVNELRADTQGLLVA